MLSSLIVAATALVGMVAAQNNSATCYYSTSGPLAIDPGCISPSLRNAWCQAQRNTCPDLCSDGQFSENSCDSTSLNYTCTCSSGNQPNISNYEQTMPYFVCQSWIEYCVAGHPNDLDGITACRSVQCGTQNATEDSTASSSGAATTSAASSTSGGPSATAASTSSTSSAAALALQVGQQYGTGVLGAGLLAVFGFFL